MNFGNNFKVLLVLIVIALVSPNISSADLWLCDNFDDDNYNGWSVIDRAGNPAEAPDVVSSPEGYSLRGVGSGYSQSPGLNVYLSQSFSVDGVGELEIEMRARSGSQWPNSATIFLESGNDMYYVTVSGEGHNYAQFASAIGGVDELYPYSFGDVGNWHDYAWSRDADGWWSLSIDGSEVWHDFRQDNRLTSFDTVGLHLLRNQSEIESVRITPAPGAFLLAAIGLGFSGWLCKRGPS